MNLPRTSLMMAFLASVAIAPFAWATDAPKITAEGAQALKAVYESYLGKTKQGEAGAVTVKPVQDHYELQIDLKSVPFLPSLFNQTITAMLKYGLTPQADGTWRVLVDTPFTAQLKSPDSERIWKVERVKLDGIYDPVLQSYLSMSAKYINMDHNRTEFINLKTRQPFAQITSHVDEVNMAAQSQRVGDNAVDFTTDWQQKNETMQFMPNLEAERPAENTEFQLLTADSQSHMSGHAVRSAQMMNLWRFVVANPSAEDLRKAQADLKQLLRDLGPGFTDLALRSKLSDINFESSAGTVLIKSVAADNAFTGLVQKGGYELAFSASGLSYTGALETSWAASLLPKDAKATVKVDNANLADATKELIEAFDLNSRDPISDVAMRRILMALVPPDGVHVAITGGEINAPDIAVHYEGRADITLNGLSAKAHITASNFDKIIETLKAAPQDLKVARQALIALASIRGFGKQQADGSMVWDIESTDGRHLSVNNMQVF